MIELGILADDLTGGMMVASLLEREGIECPLVSSTDQLAGLKNSSAQAVVVARKIRLIDPDEAAEEARQAVQALRGIGCKRFYYKYCATFDSTEQGNIGPIAEAMMTELDADRTLFCPAFPEHTVTVFQGVMFIGNKPLGNSFKKFDPVTPMTNSNLVEVLQTQSTEKVGLISHAQLMLAGAVDNLVNQPDAARLYITDSADDDDLTRIAEFAFDWPLTTGADALPIFLIREMLKRTGQTPAPERQARTILPPSLGHEVVIAGSCAGPTLRQIEHFETNHPVFRINLLDASKNENYIDKILTWAAEHIGQSPIAIATSDDVAGVEASQAELGRSGAAQLADQLLGEVAKRLYDLGARRFVVAGGETSGQVVNSLGIRRVEVSTFDELGGGYCHQNQPAPLSLILKAGALGKPEFFDTALARMRTANETDGDNQ